MNKVLLTYFSLIMPLLMNAFAQQWIWEADPEKFNPSGIEIDTLNYEFQFIDWNGDGLLDLILNQHGQLEYYEGQQSGFPKWVKKDLNLPAFEKLCFKLHTEFKDTVFSFFPNFTIGDIDNDGDWDIITDSLYLYENTGANLQPVWQKNSRFFENAFDSVIAVNNRFYSGQEEDTVKLICCFHPRLLDFNKDGKIDFLLDEYPTVVDEFCFFKHLTNKTHIFVNVSAKDTLYWKQQDSLLDVLLGRYDFFFDVNFLVADFDSDNDWDVISHSFPLSLIGIDDPTWWNCNFYIWENVNQIFEAHQLALYEIFYTQLLMHYQLIDFDSDEDQDLLVMTPRRQLEVVENLSTSAQINFNKNGYAFGRLNVESHALPFFYHGSDSSPVLIVSEDYLDVGFVYWRGPIMQGRLRNFGDWNNLNCNLDSVNYWIELERHEYDFTEQYYVNFYDYDRDGDQDFALSYMWHGDYSVKFYRNEGTGESPLWQIDSLYLSLFKNEKNFHKPYLIDLDDDNSPELFIKKDSLYFCYKNYGTISSPDWRKETSFLKGIDNLNKFLLVFADLDRDGDQDLIFGEYDGTLSYYENQGVHSAIHWQFRPDMFNNIDVGTHAAPVFADVDFDGDMDLIIGNEKGFLYYYRNESSVSVNEKYKSENIPNKSVLAQNFPNPFNAETTICFELVKPGRVTLTIFDVLGNHVRTLIDEEKDAGSYSVKWDAKDEKRADVASGIYFYKMQADNFVETKKLVLIR